MRKHRELRDGDENTASRREFLHRAGAAGLAVVAAAAPHPCLAQPASRRVLRTRARSLAAAVRYRHVVSALTHPAYGKHAPYLVLTYDPNAATPILLDEAADSKDGNTVPRNQLWEFAQIGNDLVIRNAPNKLLTRTATPDTDPSLKLDGPTGTGGTPGEYQKWWIGRQRDHDLILTPVVGGKQYALYVPVPPTLNGNGDLVPSEVKLSPVNLAETHLDEYIRSWKIISADGIPLKAGLGALNLSTHVPDQCDSTWHNPACPGNPATWTGCSYDSVHHVCNCSHA